MTNGRKNQKKKFLMCFEPCYWGLYHYNGAEDIALSQLFFICLTSIFQGQFD